MALDSEGRDRVRTQQGPRRGPGFRFCKEGCLYVLVSAACGA